MGAELHLDGIVGPTHSYAGLASGNRASAASRGATSDPRAAALEGIAKMRVLVALGVPQAVLPPHERPHVPTLRRLGFSGDDARVIATAGRSAPGLLAACSSASAMWAANAATVAPSADAADGRVHLTPANLVANAHRAIEAATTTRVLRRIFADARSFVVHEPLPPAWSLADEGAANHLRLAGPDEAGVQVFVFGRPPDPAGGYGARHSRAASEGVARLHGLGDDRTLLARQSPAAIAAGAFHNDVVGVAHHDLILIHERALADQEAVLAAASGAFARTTGRPLRAVVVPDREVGLEDAVRSYLFNGQLVTAADGGTVLVIPRECVEEPVVAAWLDRLAADPAAPVARVVVVDVRQSMRNGGGPACLRLRVPLTDAELGRVAPGVMVDDALLDDLEEWVRRHYRDRLEPADLADPQLMDEGRVALDELSALLGLGAIHDFQGAGGP